MMKDEQNIERMLRDGLAPAPTADIDHASQRVYARLQSTRRLPDAPVAWAATRERRAVGMWRPVATLAAAAALVALSIWGGMSMRDESIAVLEAADGSVSRLDHGEQVPVRAGERIDARQTIQASGGGTAVLSPFQHIGILSLEFHVDKLSRPLL